MSEKKYIPEDPGEEPFFECHIGFNSDMESSLARYAGQETHSTRFAYSTNGESWLFHNFQLPPQRPPVPGPGTGCHKFPYLGKGQVSRTASN